jgi:uracil-DNA glycosylase family 4
MNPSLQLAVRNAVCTDCKLHTQADGKDVCVTGSGPSDATIAVVTKNPLGSRGRTELEGYFKEAGIDVKAIMWMSAVKCRVWDMDPGKTELKACRPYLTNELDFIHPSHVLMLGNEALQNVAGNSGIMKYRGKCYNLTTPGGHEFVAMPTIAPGMVARNPGFRDGLLADLKYFKSLVAGEDRNDKDPYHMPGDHRRTYVGSKAVLRSLLTALNDADVVSYDVETTRAEAHMEGAAVVSIALTLAGSSGMDTAHVWEVPLFHPQSPWRKSWVQVLIAIVRHMMKVKRRIAHNAKFDSKWLQHFTDLPIIPTFDTIIAMAVLDENKPKGLKPNAQQILGADPWGIDTKDLLNTELTDVLEYNGLDTWHTLRLYYHFRALLKKQPRILKLFVHLMMPLVQELTFVERRGVYVDQEVLATNTNIALTTLEDIEDELEKFLPDELPERFVNRRSEEQINFGPSNFARWMLFDHLQLPVLARGKPKENGQPGMPSMAESIMLELAEIHPAGTLMVNRALWYKRITGFFNPYGEILTKDSRIHTTFKPWGTVTGRLSSGKEDSEKITARGDVRGVNIQQVPRDKLLRGVFGAPPGSWFVQADYSQVELRIAAFLAREMTMLHLYASGRDIHMTMAMRMTGKPASQVTYEERKAAKAVNFGFLYGMGWMKFISTAWSNYQLRVTEEEARAFRTAFFDQFPMLPGWHRRQRILVRKYKRVETPMGRVRHLPDIDSPDQGVAAEAERQAINSPVQAMASDMAALSLVHIARDFRKRGMMAHPVGTVHDAVLFEIPDNEMATALPLIKDTMENLPLERMFGINLDVPIVADLTVGPHWGGGKELSIDEIYNWKGLVAA